MRELTPTEVQTELARGAILLDVRQPEELELAAVRGALHIPMGEIPHRLAEVRTDATIAVLCHHGARSMQVARFLERNGYVDVINITGGIDAWSGSVDTSIPHY